MTDALTLIRQYTIAKKQIESRDNLVFLGDFCWDIKSETNYMVYGTGRDGQPKEFYSIETILFFLENADKLSHPHYVKVKFYRTFKFYNRVFRPRCKSLAPKETKTIQFSEQIEKVGRLLCSKF